jgi:hypothetical protein
MIDVAYCHAHQIAVSPMEAHQLAEVDLQKGVAIQHQEVFLVAKVRLGEFQGTGSSERVRFSRVSNGHIPIATAPESIFDLFAQMPRAHYLVADSLIAQLQHQ